MAHLPRWIARLDVDSQAMLGAFTYWYGKASTVDRDTKGELTAIRLLPGL